jgi:hypothetical protein
LTYQTCLVCLDALHQADRDREEARQRCGNAAAILMMCRNKLDQAVEQAYSQQSFRPIMDLACKEEAALAAYERAKTQLAHAEERCSVLRVALAYEKKLMMAGPLPRKRLN